MPAASEMPGTPDTLGTFDTPAMPPPTFAVRYARGLCPTIFENLNEKLLSFEKPTS